MSWNWDWCPRVLIGFDADPGVFPISEGFIGPYHIESIGDFYDLPSTVMNYPLGLDTPHSYKVTVHDSPSSRFDIWAADPDGYFHIAAVDVLGGGVGDYSTVGWVQDTIDGEYEFMWKEFGPGFGIVFATQNVETHHFLAVDPADSRLKLYVWNGTTTSVVATGDVMSIGERVTITVTGGANIVTDKGISTTIPAITTDAFFGVRGTSTVGKAGMLNYVPPGWTDVTDYVLDNGLTITRGRRKELDVFGAGTCKMVLRNDKRAWDGENPSSPFFGKIRPRLPIVVDMNTAGGMSRRFTGYVMRFPHEPGFGFNDEHVVAECTDAGGVLAQTNLESVYWVEHMQNLNPWAWLRFNEVGEVPPLLSDSSTNARNFLKDHTLTSGPVGGAESLNPLDSESFSFNPGKEAHSLGTGPTDNRGGYQIADSINDMTKGFTVCFYLNAELIGQEAERPILVQSQSGSANRGIEIGITSYNPGGAGSQEAIWSPIYMRVAGTRAGSTAANTVAYELRSSFDWSSGTIYSGPISGHAATGRTYFVTCWYRLAPNSGGGPPVPQGHISMIDIETENQFWANSYSPWTYVQPGEAGITPPDTAYGDQIRLFSLGPNPGMVITPGTNFYGGFVDELAIFDEVLPVAAPYTGNPLRSSRQIQNSAYRPGSGRYVRERLWDLLTLAQTADVHIPHSFSVSYDNDVELMLGGATKMGGNSYSLMQDTARNVHGSLYTTKHGVLAYRERFELSSAKFVRTASIVFGDRPDLGELPYEEVVPSLGDEKIVNSASVTTSKHNGSTSYTAEDQSSMLRYFRQKEVLESDGVIGYSNFSKHRADWVVSQYAHPLAGFTSMVVRSMNDPDMIAAMSSLDLESIVTVNRRVAGSPTPTERAVSIQGYTEDISRMGWAIDYWLTSSAQSGQEFMIIDDEFSGIIGQNRAGF